MAKHIHVHLRTLDHFYNVTKIGDFQIMEGAGTNGGEWRAQCATVYNESYKKGEYETFKSRNDAERFAREASD